MPMNRSIAGIVLCGLWCAGCSSACGTACEACGGDEERIFLAMEGPCNGKLEAPFTVAPREADRELACHSRIFVLDVRPPERYANGHLRNAVLIPAEKLPENINGNLLYPEINQGRAPERGQRILVYDDSDVRAAAVVGNLRRMGFANSSYIAGGAPAWENSGLPLEFGDGR